MWSRSSGRVRRRHPRLGTSFVEAEDGELSAAYFHSCNRGKRSIAADFEDARGAGTGAQARSPCGRRHRELQGRRPEEIRARLREPEQINPRLVYCSITGFGQDGPYASRAGYDFMIQGMGGIMDLTGDPDGEPQKIGVAYVDIFTGVYSVVGILAALRKSNT